jgi:hypothetical protein
VRIIDLRPGDEALVRQVARLLVDGFREPEPGILMAKRVAP